MAYLKYPAYPLMPEEIKQEIFDVVAKSENTRLDTLLISSSEEILNLVENAYDPNINKSKLGYSGQEARERFPGLVKYSFIDVSDTISKWVNTHIPIKYDSINIQVMEEGSIIPPHIDELRSKAYNYLIQTGGDVSLIFYELNDYKDNTWIHPQMFIPYDKVTKKEEIKVPLDRWHLLPANKIHSVENINPGSKRISLTLSVI